MNIFEIILSPFIFIIKQLFLFGYQLTENYGWAIILLSFAISALLLPIFIIIEKAKKRDDAVKRKMKPLLNEIKRCYKGQERYYYLKTLNRQHNYSPLRALIPILSLLLQIPFFIAAYQFLEHFEPLQGVQFWFIKNLAAPDALFGAINILPIAMTLINLLTAYFYTRNGDTSERKQMLIVAGIFLILLFKLPAGLVLYWTMNNVFSFFRLFITNPEVFRKSEKKKSRNTLTLKEIKLRFITILPKLKVTFYVLSVLGILSQLNWIFNNSFNGLALRLLFIVAVCAGVVLLIGLFTVVHKLKEPINVKSVKKLFTQLWSVFNTTFFIILTFAVLSQINWALKFSFNGFILRLLLSVVLSVVITLLLATVSSLYYGLISITAKELYYKIIKIGVNQKGVFTVRPSLFFSLIFAIIYFYLASLFYYSGFNIRLSVVSLIVLLPLQFIGFIYFKRAKNTTSKPLFILTFFLLITLFLLQLINIYILLSGVTIDKTLGLMSLLGSFGNLSDVVLPGIFFILIALPFYIKKTNINIPKTDSNWVIYLLSVLYICGFMFLWNPLVVFSSFPEIFKFQGIEILTNNLIFFIISTVGLMAAYYLIPPKNKFIGLWIMLGITVVSFLNSTIFPLDVGVLLVNKYGEQDNIAKPLYYFLTESGFIIFIFFTVKWLITQKKHLKKIILGLLLINVTLVAHSILIALNSGSFFKSKGELHINNSTIDFSSTKKNVVIVIADMFQGWTMNKLLNENSNLKNELAGFVWYPNTLSVSKITTTSIAPIIGGHNYLPKKLDLDKNHTITEKITGAMQSLSNKAHSKGFNFIANKLSYVNINKVNFDAFIPEWNSKWSIYNEKLNISEVHDKDYYILINNALFFSAPLFLKPKLYNKGNWFKKPDKNANNLITKKYNFLRLLPFISTSVNSKPAFVVLHSLVPHFPWNIIDSTGSIIYDVPSHKTAEWTLETLAKWFNWMKKKGIYDNTKIIIVSDHGINTRKLSLDIDMPFKNNTPEKVPMNDVISLNALLLVKDFNCNDTLKTDWRFMSNADVNSIAFNEKNNPANDTLQTSRVLKGSISSWSKNLTSMNKFSISYTYSVKDNIFDANNWKRIE